MFITVTHGMRGYFACLCDNWGPVQSGIGSYRTKERARKEAEDWAIAENLPVMDSDGKLYRPH